MKEAVHNVDSLTKEGKLVELVSEKGQFIAKGYYGKRNKGYGWIVTQNENEKIDQSFFERKIKAALERRKELFNSTETNTFRLFHAEGDEIGVVKAFLFNLYDWRRK